MSGALLEKWWKCFSERPVKLVKAVTVYISGKLLMVFAAVSQKLYVNMYGLLFTFNNKQRKALCCQCALILGASWLLII